MAKKEQAQETVSTRAVTFADGTTINFGKNGQIKTGIELTDEGVLVTIHTLTANIYKFSVEVAGSDYVKTLTARGALTTVSDAVSGVYKESPEDFDLTIAKAINNINNEVLPKRESGTGLRGYGDLIRAVCELRTQKQGEGFAQTGEYVFTEDQLSFEGVKGWVLSRSEEQNKALMAMEHVKALFAKYRSERAAASALKAGDVKAELTADDLI
jgi:hypothetical protein